MTTPGLDLESLMAAERAIRRRLQDYCRGIDRADAELVASVYFLDATDDHGAFKGLGADFARYATEALRTRFEATQHTIGEPTIDFVDATTAHVETYVHAIHRGRNAEGTFLERFGGRYVDRFERRNDEWKIADRLVIHEWDAREQVTLAFPEGRFIEGRRDRSDPSYPPR